MTTSPTTVSPTKLWAKRIVLAMIVIIIIAVIAESFGSSGISGIGGYSKTIQVEITTLESTRACGIQSGKRRFTAPKKIPVIIGGNNHDLEEWILVNGTVAKEQFIVADDGCVEITFALVSSDKKKSIVPQIIPIKFE